MHDSLTVTTFPVLEASGLTLVEQDDVVFSLSICHEVDRIYCSYQDRELQASENLRSALSVTLRMLACLEGAVIEGMPALGLQVATAQAREMCGVLFGDLPSAVARGSAALLPTSPPDEPELVTPSAASLSPGRDVARREGWRGWWNRRPSAIRLLLGAAGCMLAAAMIDLPLTVIALFPNLLFPLAATFVGVPALAWMICRPRIPLAA